MCGIWQIVSLHHWDSLPTDSFAAGSQLLGLQFPCVRLQPSFLLLSSLLDLKEHTQSSQTTGNARMHKRNQHMDLGVYEPRYDQVKETLFLRRLRSSLLIMCCLLHHVVKKRSALSKHA